MNRSLYENTCDKTYDSCIFFMRVFTLKAEVVQLVSVMPSVPEVPSSIPSHYNFCFDFPLIQVALSLNARKTEHLQREGIKGTLSPSIDTS